MDDNILGGSAIGDKVTLQAVDRHGDFLRVRNNNYAYCDTDENTTEYQGDVTFMIREAMDGTDGAISLESVEYPGRFLMYWGWYVHIREFKGSNSFKIHASWIPRKLQLNGISLESTYRRNYFIRREGQIYRVRNYHGFSAFED